MRVDEKARGRIHEQIALPPRPRTSEAARDRNFSCSPENGVFQQNRPVAAGQRRMLSARFAAASGRSVLVGELAVARHKRPGKQEDEENLGSYQSGRS